MSAPYTAKDREHDLALVARELGSEVEVRMLLLQATGKRVVGPPVLSQAATEALARLKSEPRVEVPLVANVGAAPLAVKHSELVRLDEGPYGSAYKSACPACKRGVLFVGRHPKTFGLQREDRCTWCAQKFVYQDESIGGEALPKLGGGT